MNNWMFRNRSLGFSPPVRELDHHHKSYTPYSVVYVCPTCSQAWGRIHVEESQTSYRITPRYCPLHGPGFLLPYQYHNLAESAPKEVLLRELLLIKEMPNPTLYYKQLWINGI